MAQEFAIIFLLRRARLPVYYVDHLMTRCSILHIIASASLHSPNWTRQSESSKRRERWHISCFVFWHRGLPPSDGYPELPITEDPFAEDFGSLNIIGGHVFTDGSAWLGPCEWWHSQHTGRWSRHSARQKLNPWPGPSSLRRLSPSSSAQKLHSKSSSGPIARVRQKKTEETSVPCAPLRRFLERSRCYRSVDLGARSQEKPRHGSRNCC